MPASLHGRGQMLVVRTVQTEGDEEGVQQCRVVGVAAVLQIQLPVRRNDLLAVADDAQRRLLEDAIEAGDQLRAAVVLEVRRGVAERSPDRAASNGHA